MDVHRSFAQIAIVEDGLCRDEGRIGVRPEELREWAAGLRPDDEVALEATTNSDAIATLLRPLVRRVVVSNPGKTRAIAEPKVKTDKVDARILAQLLAADFLPGTWVADERTRMLCRLVMRRTHLVKQRTRVKNQVHAIMARNLVPTCPHADLFSGVGQRWLSGQDLPTTGASGNWTYTVRRTVGRSGRWRRRPPLSRQHVFETLDSEECVASSLRGLRPAYLLDGPGSSAPHHRRHRGLHAVHATASDEPRPLPGNHRSTA
jgi:hypothetical protein